MHFLHKMFMSNRSRFLVKLNQCSLNLLSSFSLPPFFLPSFPMHSFQVVPTLSRDIITMTIYGAIINGGW